MAGLATAALTNPVPIPGFSVAGGNWGGGVEPWRRLLRRQPASQRRWAVGGGGDRENGSGGREQGGSRRNDVIIEREISCGYAGAVGGLLAASHGEAVRAVAAGGNGNGKGLGEKDLQIDTTSLASATGSSSGLFQGWLIGWCVPFSVEGNVCKTTLVHGNAVRLRTSVQSPEKKYLTAVVVVRFAGLTPTPPSL